MFSLFGPHHLQSPRHPAVLPHALWAAAPAVPPQLLAADPAPLGHRERRTSWAAAATHGGTGEWVVFVEWIYGSFPWVYNRWIYNGL